MESIGLFMKTILSTVVLSVVSIGSYFSSPQETATVNSISNDVVALETNVTDSEGIVE
jgi:hypothetical protein